MQLNAPADRSRDASFSATVYTVRPMPFLLSIMLTSVAQTTAQPAPPPTAGNPAVVISTSIGDITVELFKDRAPVSVANFLQYVKDGFYSGTIFHRVVRGSVVQGGGFDATLTEKPTRPPIQNEATNGLRNLAGTVAMARTRALRSATSQFYVNLANNAELDHRGFTPSDFGYAVFGRVIEGMDIVSKIAAAPTRSVGDMDDVPVEPVVIKSVTVK
jgi:peptidyl-prolyl cis-trans isomerase A (cyclophilin A)